MHGSCWKGKDLKKIIVAKVSTRKEKTKTRKALNINKSDKERVSLIGRWWTTQKIEGR